MIQLSADQEAARSAVVEAANARTYQVFYLTGKAGTGKSTLVKQIIKDLHRRASVVAPSGIAAQAVGGTTVHKFLGLGITSSVPTHGVAEKNLGVNKLLVCDEVSMLSAGLMHLLMQVAQVAKIPLLLVGDLLQLPPVPSKELPEVFSWPVYRSPLWNQVKWLELTVNHRQRDDAGFGEILDALRVGQETPALLRMLRDRWVKDIPDDAPLLTPLREQAKKRNMEKLRALKQPIKVYRAQLVQCRAGFDLYWESSVEKARVPLEVSVAIGARVVMLNNDQAGRWFNGSLGTVVDWSETTVTVELDNGQELEVGPSVQEIRKGDGELEVSYNQLPIDLAWALTIHKAQGMTMEKVAVNMTGHFASGMTYVALSRCTSAAGLYVTGTYSRASASASALRAYEEQGSAMLSSSSAPSSPASSSAAQAPQGAH